MDEGNINIDYQTYSLSAVPHTYILVPHIYTCIYTCTRSLIMHHLGYSVAIQMRDKKEHRLHMI